MHATDTIVAPITAPGRGAVAVVRISGPQAFHVASQIFSSWPDTPEPRRALYGTFSHGDDGLVLPFAEGHSYTGDETVECSVHGSPASVARLLDSCLQAGCRMAEPGEFTLRALMNGRIDLVQAEGVRETVDSLSDRQLKMASALRSGLVTQQIAEVRQLVLEVLAAVEASTDFSEEIGPVDTPQAVHKLTEARTVLARMLEGAAVSRQIREGATLAIIGRPNAGKSSLMNLLLRSDRSIVTPIAGTTRDTVEETVSLDGVVVRLIDTAGLRETSDEVEQIGIERARQAALNADIALYLVDSSVGWTPEDDALSHPFGERLVTVWNKADLAEPPAGSIAVSALSGTGMTHLLEAIKQRLHADEPATYLLDRHVPLLDQADDALAQALTTLQTDVPDDLAAVCLRHALQSLGEVTGETASADMVDAIFANFCIGK